MYLALVAEGVEVSVVEWENVEINLVWKAIQLCPLRVMM